MAARIGMLVVVVLTLGCSGLARAQRSASSLAAEAVLLKRQGKIREAFQKAQQAVRASPNDARAHYVLAWVLIKRGERQQATQHFQKALQIGLSGNDATLARQALQRLGAPPSPLVTKPSKGAPSPAPGVSALPPATAPRAGGMKPTAQTAKAPSAPPSPGVHAPAPPSKMKAPAGAPAGKGTPAKPVAQKPGAKGETAAGGEKPRGGVGGLPLYAIGAGGVVALIVIIGVIKMLGRRKRETSAGPEGLTGEAEQPESGETTTLAAGGATVATGTQQKEGEADDFDFSLADFGVPEQNAAGSPAAETADEPTSGLGMPSAQDTFAPPPAAPAVESSPPGKDESGTGAASVAEQATPVAPEPPPSDFSLSLDEADGAGADEPLFELTEPETGESGQPDSLQITDLSEDSSAETPPPPQNTAGESAAQSQAKDSPEGGDELKFSLDDFDFTLPEDDKESGNKG